MLKKYPRPQFSRDSVYQMWHNLVKAKWKSDVDEITSARNLLKKGSKPGGLSKYEVEEICITEPGGMSVIAFSIPEMIKMWGDRVREIALDSACRW